MCCTLDLFYGGEAAHQTAKEWHKRNDEEGVGPNGKQDRDRRVLWASFGDPDGVFTPNQRRIRFVWIVRGGIDID